MGRASSTMNRTWSENVIAVVSRGTASSAGTRGVGRVSGRQCSGLGLHPAGVHRPAALGEPPAGASFGRGVEKDLELGVRKHDGTDVPPVDYHVAAGPHHGPKP